MNLKSKVFTYTLSIFFVCFSAFADSPPSPLAEGQIKIDGDGSDWSNVKVFKSDFPKAGGKKTPGTIDVKSLHLGYTKTAFVCKAVFDIKAESFRTKKDVGVMQLVFDADSNDSTGNRDSKVYKVVPKGFETRFSLVMRKNRELIARLYSYENDFNKLIKEWKVGSENLVVNGETVEFKIPYDLINFKPSSGLVPIRLLLAEFANMATESGYNKINYKLNYDALNNTKATSADNNSDSSSEEEKGGFNIWHLIIITTWIVSILCGFAIAPKAGLSQNIAGLNFIPFLGQLIFLFMLAFGEWPLHKDYQKLEERLLEFDEEV